MFFDAPLSNREEGRHPMITGLLITNGGPHSSDDWALTSATMLMNAFIIKDGSPRRAALEIAKGRVQASITEIMMSHHETVQKMERNLLSLGDHSRLGKDATPEEHTDVEQAITDVRAACQPLLDILNSAEVKPGIIGLPVEHLTFEDVLMEAIRGRITGDLMAVIDIERSWHADKNPGNEHAIAFQAARIKSGAPVFIDAPAAPAAPAATV
jgi:hypothetical protein